VDQFIKDNMETDHVEVYHDDKGTNGKEFKRMIDDALNFRLRKIAVLDADIEVMNGLTTIETAISNSACHLELLGCCRFNGEWNNESEKDLLLFVRRIMLNTSNEKFRAKLECIERILRM